MPIMIWLAIIIEFAIQNWIDAGILLGIQFANATLGWCVAAAGSRRGAGATPLAMPCSAGSAGLWWVRCGTAAGSGQLQQRGHAGTALSCANCNNVPPRLALRNNNVHTY